MLVKHPSDDLLARTCLTGDENGRIRVGNALEQCPKLQDRSTRTENVVPPARLSHRCPKAFDLAFELMILKGAPEAQRAPEGCNAARSICS